MYACIYIYIYTHIHRVNNTETGNPIIKLQNIHTEVQGGI